MKNVRNLFTCAVLGALAVACRTTESAAPARSEPATTSAATPDARAWGELPAPVLYARDGTPVQGGESAPAPANADAPRPDRGVQGATRMSLLELYQKTLEEKEAYVREMQALQASVERAGATQSQLERERDEARTRVAMLEKDVSAAQADNADLAARLVTAQIRRLEAEKLLLETRIEALRRGDGAAKSTASAERAETGSLERSHARGNRE